MKSIIGVLFYLGSPIFILLILIDKIKKLKKVKEKGYKTITGKIVDYISEHDERYINYQREIYMKDNPEFYNKMSNFVQNLADDMELEKSQSTLTAYFAVIEYEVDGKKYQIFNSVGSSITGKLGRLKKIKYDPKCPSDAVIDKDFSFLILIIILLFFTAFGWLLLSF